MDCLTVEVIRSLDEPWGIQLSGESPCYVDNIKVGSPAEEAGLQKGDCIFSVNGVKVYDASHDQVVQLIAASGRMLRFNILPSTGISQQHVSTETKEEIFWTTEIPSTLHDNKKFLTTSTLTHNEENEKDTFNHTDYEKYCELLESETIPSTSKHTKKVNGHLLKENQKKKKKKKSRKSEEVIEQSKFVVTREDQRDFDKNFIQECIFQGEKASVAGAFTGDHNQITGKNDDDVRGIRSRVTAAIQHFSFDDEQEKIDPHDRGKVIVYTTGLGIHRSVAQNCDKVRKILAGFRVKFEDRDIFSSSEHKQELYQRLGLKDGAPFPEMPRVYIDGVYIGGAEEVEAMSDCGDLRIRLKQFPKFNIRSKCPTCSSAGQVVCHSCKGKTFRKKNRFAVLKCGTCDQKGYLTCPDCM